VPAKHLALVGGAAAAFTSGGLLPFLAPLGENAFYGVTMAFSLAGLFCLFAWIQFDRRERGIPRSAGFNLALVWMALVTAPVYFVRHRERGRRWQPLLGLFLAGTVGWHFLFVAGLLVGATAYTVLHALA
jgi:hypothetical protein